MSKEERTIRITLKGYDYRLLDKSAKDICETARQGGARVAGPLNLKTKIRKYCVLRSPHIDKKSRDQFEIRIHKRLIDIASVDNRVIEGLTNLQLPAGIHVDIRVKEGGKG